MKNTNFTYIAQLMNKLGQILESYFKKQEEVRSHAKNMVKKILFVCKFNRFRSKVAEAYFKKINRNRRIKERRFGL